MLLHVPLRRIAVFLMLLLLLVLPCCATPKDKTKPPKTATPVPALPSSQVPSRVPSRVPSLSLAPTPGALEVVFPKTYFTFQRQGGAPGFGGRAHLIIVGVFVGQPTAIEARFCGGEWTVIDAAPAKNVFSGILSNQPAMMGDLEIRFANDHSVTQTVHFIRVGDAHEA